MTGLSTDCMQGNPSMTNSTKPEVRRIIRGLKNKAQAAYIAASVLHAIDEKTEFLRYLHPDNKN